MKNVEKTSAVDRHHSIKVLGRENLHAPIRDIDPRRINHDFRSLDLGKERGHVITIGNITCHHIERISGHFAELGFIATTDRDFASGCLKSPCGTKTDTAATTGDED